MAAAAAAPDIRAWKPAIAGIREVFHADFREHAYPLHTHDVWTILLVDDGAVRYELEGRARDAARRTVSLLPPYVTHDGRPATDRGFRKRVLYVETSALPERLSGAAVDRPAPPDQRLPARVAALHDALECPDDTLEAETRFAYLAERIVALLGGVPRAESDAAPAAALAEALRDYLDAHLFEPVTLHGAATELAAGATQLARSFSAAFGIPPHMYVLGRRCEVARDKILRGLPLADVAAETGFYDQAHLSRRFREYLGTTPGRFRDSARHG